MACAAARGTDKSGNLSDQQGQTPLSWSVAPASPSDPRLHPDLRTVSTVLCFSHLPSDFQRFVFLPPLEFWWVLFCFYKPCLLAAQQSLVQGPSFLSLKRQLVFPSNAAVATPDKLFIYFS